MLHKFNLFKTRKEKIPILYEYTIEDIAQFYPTLITGNRSSILALGKSVYQFLEHKNIHSICKVGKKFKDRTSLCWQYNWKEVDIKQYEKYFSNKEYYVAILILGIFHPNGYFREKCLLELEHFSNTTAYILLCMNDHVIQIRTKAYQLALERVPTCDLKELLDIASSIQKLTFSGNRVTVPLEQLFFKVVRKLPMIRYCKSNS